MKQAKTLKKGDCIALVAPASSVKKASQVQQLVAHIHSWGLEAKVFPHVFASHHHFAGTDAQRQKDLQDAIQDESIQAIWFVWGGYGCVRIMDTIDFSSLVQHPKWLIGFSDITNIHAKMHALGLESVHGMMATIAGSLVPESRSLASVKAILLEQPRTVTWQNNAYNKGLKMRGSLVGGNLCIVASLLGSPTAIDTKHKILFLEEVAEYDYKIDRMLRSLERAGMFEDCAGLLLGSFNHIPENDPPFGASLEEIVLEVVKNYDFPVFFDFPAGHITENEAMVFGRELAVESKDGMVFLEYTESAD